MLLAIAQADAGARTVRPRLRRRWVNWRTYLAHRAPQLTSRRSRTSSRELKSEYAPYTPEFAERESGVPAATIVQVAREIAAARPAFASHIWRAGAAGNLHGWQITRALMLLNVLTRLHRPARAACSRTRGTSSSRRRGASPRRTRTVERAELAAGVPTRAQRDEHPVPALPARRRGTQPVLFTRVLNPIWTFPDGYSWLRALRDEDEVGLHGALTPTWSETAWWADYVLPMGHGPERHDTHSYETHAGRWLGFRQPVQRVAMERMGTRGQFTYEANPGEVWEEGEFWIELSWRADPDGSLGHPPATTSRRTGPARRSRSRSTTGGCSRTPFRDCPRRPPPRGSSRSSTCAATARSRSPATSTTSTRAEVEDLGRADARCAGASDTVTKVRFDGAHLPLTGRPGHDRGGRRRDRPARLQHPVAQARAVLRDARRVGLAGARDARRTRAPTYTTR